MSDDSNQFTDQVGSFQKIWMETFSRMAQTAFSFSPDSAPPEMIRQMRSGIFQALAQSWDEYLRSPQFLEGMKQWMDNAILFRKMSNDFFTKARHETQDLAREDVDSVMLAVRHMEKRILDRLEELSARVDAVNPPSKRARVNGAGRTPARGKSRPAAAASANAQTRTARTSANTKQKPTL
jgi:hypothetical protein